MDDYKGPPREPTAPPYPGPPLNPNLWSIDSQLYGPAAHPAHLINPQQCQVMQTEASGVVIAQSLPTDVPGRMVCPHCENSIITEITYKNGQNTWELCMLLGFMLCLPFIWIPFCIKSCKDVAHSCPNCQKVIHIHKSSVLTKE